MTASQPAGHRDWHNDFDLDAKDFSDNYDEVLSDLVERCPVAKSNVAGGYRVVTRHEDVRACAQDWQTFSSEGGFEPGRGGEGGAKLYPVELDPPYQRRWRLALGPYFNPGSLRTTGAIELYEDSIREQVTHLIDGFIEDGKCDFVEQFAAQLPGRVFFASFLGVPFSELPPIQEATDVAMRGPMDQRMAAWGQIAAFLDDYLTARQKQEPRGDFVDAILRGVEDKEGNPCPWEHKLYVLTDLLAGGIGTTTYLLSGMAYHLATHPEDRARLAQEPALRPNAIEEFIRYYAAIVALGRTATRDTEVAGEKIAKDDFLMLSFASACRDPKVFDRPNEVDLDRHIAVNPAFSFGPHRCIGSHVARMEAKITMEELLRRMPDIAVPDGREPTYSNSTITRNMDTLPIVFTPHARTSTAQVVTAGG